MSRYHSISRRDFLKLAGAGLGSAMLASCKKGVKLTAESFSNGTPPPAVSSNVTPLPAGTVADTILANGRIMTVDASNSIAEAIALKGDKILRVGSNQEINSLVNAATKVINLNGRTVTPGFIDPHIHFRIWGLQNSFYTGFMPPEVKDIPTLQSALKEAVKRLQPGEWLMGYYLVLTDKMVPTREDLDTFSPHNPVFIMHIGGHWGTANNAAMQIAGITAGTQSPDGGIIEKVNGELTGVFYNHRAMDLVRKFAPTTSIGDVKQAILDTQKAFAASGVTSFHDNNIRDVAEIQAYQELARDGLLALRNELYLTLEWPSDWEKVAQVKPMDDAVTHFAGYKFLIDGQGPTAYTHEAHTGPSWKMPTWDPAIFKEGIRRCHDTGLQICVHTIGDAAADLTLEAYEAAMNANPRPDPRHRIEHAILTTPQATQKMKDLGVVVSTQPAFTYVFGEGYKNLFSPAQLGRVLVTREWLEAGVHVAIGSDAPSTPLYNPGATLAGAMTRLTFKKDVLGKEQIFNFTQALRAHTCEGAYSAHQENIKGTLEAGKYADLVVWPVDPAKMDGMELAAVKTVDMTMVGGKVVYEKG